MNASELRNIIWDYTRKINENMGCIFDPVCEQYGITMLQAGILMELSKYESLTIGSLAEGICVAGTNISSMCKKLESMGLLNRVRAREDERVVKVTLTEKGNVIVFDIDRLFSEKVSQIMDDETLKAINDIVMGMQKLDDLLQKIASD